MSWTIVADHLEPNTPDSQKGHEEDFSRIPVLAAVLGHVPEKLPEDGPRIPFRLYDDDGELYYQGLLHDDDECLNQFAALRWGESYAGCTTIKVQRETQEGGLRVKRWVQDIG